LVESKVYWGGLVTWLNPKSTRWTGDLVESKEHWGGQVAWLNPKNTGGGDYTKRWCREVDNFK
jgi:hypothetical protein